MSINYRYNAGYGFLVPMNKFPLPSQWDDRDLWFSGDLEPGIASSGITPIIGGDMMCGNELWGFVATDTLGSLNKYSNDTMVKLRDINPDVVGSVYEMKHRSGVTDARVGWMMWTDIS